MQLSPPEYLVHIFGGVRATSRALGIAASAVSKWQKKGYIPSHNMPKILIKAEEMGLDLRPEDLVVGRSLKRSELVE